MAVQATLHCLTGCAIGEVLGMVISTWLGFSDAASIAISVFLAFVFGYGLTLLPLVRPDGELSAATGRPVQVLWQTGHTPVDHLPLVATPCSTARTSPARLPKW